MTVADIFDLRPLLMAMEVVQCPRIFCYITSTILWYYIQGGAIHIRDSIDLCIQHNHFPTTSSWLSCSPIKLVYHGNLWTEGNQASGGKRPFSNSPRGAVVDRQWPWPSPSRVQTLCWHPYIPYLIGSCDELLKPGAGSWRVFFTEGFRDAQHHPHGDQICFGGPTVLWMALSSIFLSKFSYPYSTPEQGLTDPTGRWVLES